MLMIQAALRCVTDLDVDGRGEHYGRQPLVSSISSVWSYVRNRHETALAEPALDSDRFAMEVVNSIRANG